jgi:hypothetical protein
MGDTQTDTDQSAELPSDEQLMVAFSRGSADAFSDLFSRYKQPLFGFFRRRLTDPARLNEVLHKSHGQTKDILEIERESARVRGEIERMEAERKALQHRVEYATIEIQITEDYKAQITSLSDNVATRIHNAFVSGYRNASETLLGMLLFSAEYGPTLLVWLLFLLVPLILIWRRCRRVLFTI